MLMVTDRDRRLGLRGWLGCDSNRLLPLLGGHLQVLSVDVAPGTTGGVANVVPAVVWEASLMQSHGSALFLWRRWHPHPAFPAERRTRLVAGWAFRSEEHTSELQSR